MSVQITIPLLFTHTLGKYWLEEEGLWGQSRASVADEFLTQDVALAQYLLTDVLLHCCALAIFTQTLRRYCTGALLQYLPTYTWKIYCTDVLLHSCTLEIFTQTLGRYRAGALLQN